MILCGQADGNLLTQTADQGGSVLKRSARFSDRFLLANEVTQVTLLDACRPAKERPSRWNIQLPFSFLIWQHAPDLEPHAANPVVVTLRGIGSVWIVARASCA